MKKLLITLVAALAIGQSAKAQWAVIDPSNLAQNIISALKTGSTAATMIDSFQETVKIYNQGKEFYDALKSVKNLVKDARKVQQTILMIGDISDIYVNSFQKMLSDPYFSIEEIEAIASGYAILLTEASNVLADLKSIINENGLSLNDSERMSVIDLCYNRIFEYRALTQYYTNKNIGVSWLRAKKQNDTDRIMALYGSPSERYW